MNLVPGLGQYLKVSEMALNTFLHFYNTYLSEVAFLTLNSNNKKR